MSWRDAPLYVEAFDLVAWLEPKLVRWLAGTELRPFADRSASAAAELLESVALALTFPARRAAYLQAADESVVRLRIWLRLAERAGALERRQLRFAAERLAAIGAMLGGWQKRIRRRPPTAAAGVDLQEAGHHR